MTYKNKKPTRLSGFCGTSRTLDVWFHFTPNSCNYFHLEYTIYEFKKSKFQIISLNFVWY